MLAMFPIAPTAAAEPDRLQGAQPAAAALHQRRGRGLLEPRGVPAPGELRHAGDGPGDEARDRGGPRGVRRGGGVLQPHGAGVEARVP